MATKKNTIPHNTIPHEVTEIFDEVKETAQDVGGRRTHSSVEEKITTVVGILLFAWGLWFLRDLIGGIILLLIGGLLISGFFNEPLSHLFKNTPAPKKTTTTKVKAPAPEKKTPAAPKKTTKK